MEMQLNVKKLKQLRESKAWSQSQLADVAGISLRTVQRIEKSGVASPESVMSICSAYDIQTSDIIE
ncbi:helix-turn-helix transcriptional regulator, partial [Pseudoalteromonas ulvae]